MRRPFLVVGLAAAACSSSPASGPAPTTATPTEPAPLPPTSCERTMTFTPHTWGDLTIAVTPDDDLQAVIDAAPDGAVLELAAGRYEAKAAEYTDATCGNCAAGDPRTPAATRGFVVTGKSLRIHGAGQDQTVLVTNAGYGLLVEDACELDVEALTITGGKRDPDGDASDAAVLVRRARASLAHVTIRDNTALLPKNGYPGIAGILCREDSDVLVTSSRVWNNSWDGMAVYRDGRLRVFGSTIGKGNGVGVGSTWNGRALVVNNDVSGYWKGIGAFVDAHVEAYANVVHHQKGWGLWAADRGELVAINNTVAYNDQLGVFLASPASKGRFTNNLVAYNGLNRTGAYTPDTFGRAGIRGPAGAASTFAPAHNVVFGNQVGDWLASDLATTFPVDQWGDNASFDPGLVSDAELRPSAGSALVDAGDPAILDADGSRSDVGSTGGPYAGKTAP